MRGTRALFQRFSQPLHDELDIPGLNLSPAFDFGLISILWVFFEILLASCLANDCSLVNFTPMNGSFIRTSKRGTGGRATASGYCRSHVWRKQPRRNRASELSNMPEVLPPRQQRQLATGLELRDLQASPLLSQRAWRFWDPLGRARSEARRGSSRKRKKRSSPSTTQHRCSSNCRRTIRPLGMAKSIWTASGSHERAHRARGARRPARIRRFSGRHRGYESGGMDHSSAVVRCRLQDCVGRRLISCRKSNATTPGASVHTFGARVPSNPGQ
jgi:hypothetical protein